MTGTIVRTACPQCQQVGGLYIVVKFVASPLGTFSLAGGGVKLSGQELPVVECRNCPFTLVGEFDGQGYAIFNPRRQSSDSPAPHSQNASAS